MMCSMFTLSVTSKGRAVYITQITFVQYRCKEHEELLFKALLGNTVSRLVSI